MTNDFWSGVLVGAFGFALVALMAAWFRKKLSEFLKPSKKQKVGQSTDKTPLQVLMASLWAGIQIIIGLAILVGAIYVLAGNT